MSTESTTAEVVTEAPAAAIEQVTPPEQAADLKGIAKSDHRATVIAQLAARRAGSPQAATTQAEDKGAATATGEAPAATAEAEPEKDKEDADKQAEKPAKVETDADLAAARALNEIALAGRKHRERIQRELSDHAARVAAKEKEIADREAKLAERSQSEAKLVAALEAARTSNDPIALLKAAGVTDEQLRGSFFVDALSRLDSPQTQDQPKPPKVPTAEEIVALVRKEREDQERAAEAKKAADAEAQTKADQDRYFGLLTQEFKTGNFPLVAAINPSMGELHAALLSHFNATGESLVPTKLLQKFEDRYKAAGVTVATKATPKPAAKVPAATTRTITPAAIADAGDQKPPADEKKPRTARDVREEGFKRWQEGRSKRAHV